MGGDFYVVFFLGYEEGKINDPWTLDTDDDYYGNGHPGIQ